MPRPLVVLLIGVFLFLSGCATVYNPATEQNEFIFIGTSSEVSLGKAISAQISQKYKISNDTEQNKRLNEIGNRVASVSDRKDLKYYFNVIEDKELNAFTTPGGYVYVNSGVMENSTDDELACVMGHEIGHIAARHIAKKLQAQLGYDILVNLAAHKSGFEDFQQAVSVGYNLVMLGYSREDELLADKLGVKYAHKSGYDPYAMISFLEKIKDSEGENLGPVFLRSHPYASQRIKILKKEIPGLTDETDNKTTVVQAKDIKDEKTEKRPLKVMCPVCRRIFPGTTKYCPYDGAKLE